MIERCKKLTKLGMFAVGGVGVLGLKAAYIIFHWRSGTKRQT
jgi:hypothetical protein